MELKNPHSILAVLETRPKDIQEIRIPARAGDIWGQIQALAERNGIRVKSGTAGREGTAEAVARERQALTSEELFQGARDRADGHGLWLALDQIQDPHNLGAIFRTAAFFGVEGILLTQERSAPLSATVYDVASGGVEYVPFAIPANLQRAFEIAKDSGLWILGTSEHVGDDLAKIEKDRPWLLVFGNEEKGLRHLTEEKCDLLCKIPGRGNVTSLNVSVAAGISIAALSS